MPSMSPVPNNPAGRRVYDLDREHVFHSWSAQGSLDPITIERADGVYLWDFDGKQYLDFCSQLMFTNLGYQHPKVVAAIAEQSNKLCTIGPSVAVASRGEAALAITELLPDTHQKVFFTNGGADANENAMRMARLFTGRDKVLSAYRSYHGNTNAAIMATGDQRRWPNEYATGHAHFFGPFLYRSPFWSTTEAEECERALAHLEQLINFEGPNTVAAILLESVIGSAGIIPPPAGYLAGVRELCNKYGIVYIADEVMVGFGRTGSWFGFQQYLDDSQTPDLITFAKGVNSGYVPLGGVILSNQIAESFGERMFPGGLTYSGHPLACASAVANIAALHEERILDNVDEVGNRVLGPALKDLSSRHSIVGDVRGLGMFWGIDLVSDRNTREPLAPYGGTSPQMAAIGAAAREHGLLLFMVGNRIHVTPPLVLTAQQAREGVDLLDRVLGVVA